MDFSSSFTILMVFALLYLRLLPWEFSSRSKSWNPRIMDVMRSFSVFMLTWFTTILADRVQISSSTRSPFSRRVEPVSTISTIPSERPSSGASSTEPSILITRTSIALLSKKALVIIGDI